MNTFDPRDIVDWDYYRKRVGNNIQKIVTIPAAMQNIKNPLPVLAHPPWLSKKIRQKNDPFRQRNIKSFFKKVDPKDRKKKKAIKDIEDIENVETKKKDDSEMVVSPKKMDVEPQKPAENVIVPNLKSKDYDKTWHKQNKEHWKRLRSEKRKRGKVNRGAMDQQKKRRLNPEDVKKPAAKDSFGGPLTNMQQINQLYKNKWHVVQIVPGDVQGQFILWSFINKGSLQPIRVNVKRDVYVNIATCKDEQKFTRFGKVNRILPRERPPLNLYHLTFTEEEFDENEKDIGLYVAHPKVEGVYETQVPSEFKLTCELGNVAQVSRFTRKNSELHLQHGFDLEELVGVQDRSETRKYLDREQYDYTVVYFYHSAAKNGHGALFGLFVGDKNDQTTYHASVVAVRPTKRAQVEEFNARSYAAEIGNEQFDIDLNLSVNREIVNSMEAAFKS
eukprot:UN31357